MRIVDCTGIRDENGKIPFSIRLRKTLSEGFGWQGELDAQDKVTDKLSTILGGEFILLRNVEFPGLGTSIPLVLVGPPGVFVIHASNVRGTYRAKGDAWLTSDAAGKMKPSRPNLPTRTRLYAEAVRKYLQKNGLQLPETDAVLIFTRTDAFVENIKAQIRIVLCDGIENYTSSLRLQHPILTNEEVAQTIRLLTVSVAPQSEKSAAADESIAPQAVIMPSGMEEESADVEMPQGQSLREMFSEAAEGPYVSVFSQSAPQATTVQKQAASAGLAARLHLSRSQFLILVFGGLIDLVTICLLVIIVFVLLQ